MTAPKTEKAKRQIIVLYDFSSSSDNALRHGLKMCFVLKAGLTLVYPLLKGEDASERGVRKVQMKALVSRLQLEYGIEVQAFAPDKKLKFFFRPLYEQIEGIMLVAGITGKNFVCGLSMVAFLKLVRKSRVPWLTVPEFTPVGDYNHVVLPISYSRQTKEKIAWASYFHRLNQSAIHVLAPKGKDGFIKIGIYKNTEFLKKMYTTLEIYFKLIQTEKTINDIDEYALSYASEHLYAPVIITVTPSQDIFDLLFGATERKIIMNQQGIPVLCINPLDDMYVVCS